MINVPGCYFTKDSNIMSTVVFTERIPEILTRVIDQLNKRASFLDMQKNEEMKEDVLDAMRAVVDLRNKCMKSRPFENIDDGNEDNQIWNHDIKSALTKDGEEKCWLNCTLLFSEVYYYRKLFEIFQKTQFHKEFDYFMLMKNQTTHSAEPFIKIAANFFKSIFDDFHPTKEHLKTLFLFSTFSNQIDLSLMHGNAKVELESENFKIEDFIKFLITDDLEDVCDYIASFEPKVRKAYHFVLDNCGLEFFCDILIALYLLRTLTASKIIFHIKKFPTFVSDVTFQDYEFMSSYLSKSNDDNLKFVNNLLRTYLKTDMISFESDFSWNFHHYYSDLLDVWPNFKKIYQEFENSSLVIFKGDLNTRRLCGEKHWDLDTPMKVAVGNISRVPLLVLRTIKSVTYCNLNAEAIKTVSGLKEDWFMAGDKAQIIYINTKN